MSVLLIGSSSIRGNLMAQRDKHTTTEYICVDAYSPGIANTTATGREQGPIHS